MLNTYQDAQIDQWCARRRAQRRIEAIMLEETRIITPIPASDAWLNSTRPEPVSGVMPKIPAHMLLYDAVQRILSLEDIAGFIHESIERYQETIGRAPESVWVAEFNKAFYEIYRTCKQLPPPDIPVVGDEELRATGMITYEIPLWTAICVGN